MCHVGEIFTAIYPKRWKIDLLFQIDHNYTPSCCSSSSNNQLRALLHNNNPVNTKHLYNICTMLDQRRRRWADVVQMLYKYFVFVGNRQNLTDFLISVRTYSQNKYLLFICVSIWNKNKPWHTARIIIIMIMHVWHWSEKVWSSLFCVIIRFCHYIFYSHYGGITSVDDGIFFAVWTISCAFSSYPVRKQTGVTAYFPSSC